jgi:hypothetical protein
MRKALHKLSRQDGKADARLLPVVILVAIVIAVAVVVATHGSSSKGGSSQASASGALTISATDAAGKTEETVLTCKQTSKGSSASADGFSLQPPATLCADALRLRSTLTSASTCASEASATPLGSEKATIVGKVGSQSVRQSYDRSDACQESRFVAVLSILPLATPPKSTGGSDLSGYQAPTRNTLLFSLSGRSLVIVLAPPVSPSIQAHLSSGPITLVCAVGHTKATLTTRWDAANKVVVPVPGTAPIKSCKMVIHKAVFSEVTFGA